HRGRRFSLSRYRAAERTGQKRIHTPSQYRNRDSRRENLTLFLEHRFSADGPSLLANRGIGQSDRFPARSSAAALLSLRCRSRALHAGGSQYAARGRNIYGCDYARFYRVYVDARTRAWRAWFKVQGSTFNVGRSVQRRLRGSPLAGQSGTLNRLT